MLQREDQSISRKAYVHFYTACSCIFLDSVGNPSIPDQIDLFHGVCRKLKPTREEEIAFGKVVEVLSRVSSEAATRFVERAEREGLGAPMMPLLAMQASHAS